MTSSNRDLGPRLHVVIEANEELHSRSAMKSAVMAAAIAEALQARGVPSTIAQVAAELGVLAFGSGYHAWAEPSRNADPGELGPYALAALEDWRVATAALR